MFEGHTAVSHRRRLESWLEHRPQTFDSAEHRQLADMLHFWRLEILADLHTADWDSGIMQLADDLKLSYGQIIALAGDLYGVPDRPISSGKDDEDRRKRFTDAFNTLVNCNRDEVKKILAIMDEEATWIAKEIREGKSAAAAYSEGPDFDDKYIEATGGTNPVTNPGRYLKLANTNFDHFGGDAVTAYSAGHAVAIDMAVKASKKLATAGRDTMAREKAYRDFQLAMAASAFADHFLTDLFSSGHLRVPRRALAKAFDTKDYMHAAGSMMSKVQHDEDSRFGLFVRNAKGRCWKCYGDGHLLTVPGQDNAALAREAVNVSMTEVWCAFRDGFGPDRPEKYGALQLTPDLKHAQRHESKERHAQSLNFAAAFIERNGDPLSRYPFNDSDAHHWVAIRETAVPHPAWAGRRPESSPEAIPLKVMIDTATKAASKVKPPAATLGPPTEAPQIVRWERENRTASPSGQVEMRWAVVFVGRKDYLNNEGSTEYLSDFGPWSPYVATRPQETPVISVPRDPSGRAIGRRLMRQIKGRDPVMSGAYMSGNGVNELREADIV